MQCLLFVSFIQVVFPERKVGQVKYRRTILQYPAGRDGGEQDEGGDGGGGWGARETGSDWTRPEPALLPPRADGEAEER